MVRHEGGGDNFWTLPGGGIEPGESHEQAVIREILEETYLHVKVIGVLFKEPYSQGETTCYLAEEDGKADAKLGLDPEENDTPFEKRRLKEVAWHKLESLKDDVQVSKVINTLSLGI
jgi:8-oxo-dGTP diphosphatase